MKTLSYTLWSYDVWGNDRDGYEVNDRCCLTRDLQIEVSGDDVKDEEVIKALKDSGYLKSHVQHRHLLISGEDTNIEVEWERNSFPLFGLELNQ